MLIASAKWNRLQLQCIDAALAALAFLAAYFIRTKVLGSLAPLEHRDIGELDAYLVCLPVIVLLAPFILYRLGYYDFSISQRWAHIINVALQVALVLFLAMVLFQFMFKLNMSRLVFMIFVPIYAGVLHLREVVTRLVRSRDRKNFRNLMVVKDSGADTGWGQLVKDHPEYGFRLSKEVALPEITLSHFIEAMHNDAVELVIFDVHQGSLEKVVEAVNACEDEGIEAWLTTDFVQTRVAQAKVDYFHNRPLLIFRSAPEGSWQMLFKSAFDRLAATGMLVVLSPVMLLIGLLVKWTSPGPVFFRQERSGHYGRPFVMFKFRSMVSNAEQARNELAQFNEMSGPVFKITEDPRITSLGKWLRAWSLDELPQLFNVLNGEMSLVGPRPLPVYETLAISENAQRRRLSVKPGLTCLWQVGGRNQVSDFKDWVRMDLEYIDRWSLWLDFKILFMTIPAVLARHGAK